MDAELKEELANMYTFIRQQQELILALDVKIRALEMALSTKEGFHQTHHEALEAVQASGITQQYELMLRLIDAAIQRMKGVRPPYQA